MMQFKAAANDQCDLRATLWRFGTSGRNFHVVLESCDTRDGQVYDLKSADNSDSLYHIFHTYLRQAESDQELKATQRLFSEVCMALSLELIMPRDPTPGWVEFVVPITVTIDGQLTVHAPPGDKLEAVRQARASYRGVDSIELSTTDAMWPEDEDDLEGVCETEEES
jgi:hypothetical protein